MSPKLINFIFSILKLTFFIPMFAFLILELDKSVDLYLNNSWVYENGIYVFTVLLGFYIVIVIIEIIFFLTNKFIFDLYFENQDNYLIFDITGIVAFVLSMIDFIKNKSFSTLFNFKGKSVRNVLKRISYEEFDKLENIYDKRRALVNGLMANKIKPKEFKNKIDKLKF